MAISLEELTSVALEGSVGPVTLAVGASALAVALAAGSTRPLRRIATTSVVAAERAGQFNVRDWFVAVKQGWFGLIEEARAEYEASKRPSAPAVESPLVVATSSGAVPTPGSVILVPQSVHMPLSDEELVGERTRDQRGRFVRRATNGLQPE